MSGDPVVGEFSRKDRKENLKKKYFSKLFPKETYLQPDWTCTVLFYFVNKGDPFLKPHVQVFAQARMTPFLLLRCPHCSPPSPLGTWGPPPPPLTWINPKEIQASTFFLFCLEILSNLRPKLVPGTRHNFDICIRLRLQGDIEAQRIIVFLDLRYRK